MTFSGFFEALSDLDFVAVLVATLAVVALGSLWYGFFPGRRWSAAAGVEYVSPPPAMKMVQTLVYVFAFNVGIAYMGASDDVEHALVFGGLLIGVLIVGSLMYAAVVWRSYSSKAFLLDLPYLFLAGSLAVYVQGLMA